jgi:hypothetical protein
MKNFALSLVAALTLSTPAFALSWRDALFSKLDADVNGEIALTELTATGCRVDTKLFKYADADRSQGLNKVEYFTNREFFSRCK